MTKKAGAPLESGAPAFFQLQQELQLQLQPPSPDEERSEPRQPLSMARSAARQQNCAFPMQPFLLAKYSRMRRNMV